MAYRPRGFALTHGDQEPMAYSSVLSGQVLALLSIMTMSYSAIERRIEVPLDQTGRLPVAEVIRVLSQASGG